MANGDLFQMTYVPESTYGTTPAAGSWKTLRLVSDGITAEPETTISEEIAGVNVGPADLLFLGLTVGGDNSIEFSADTYDDFLEACLGGTWAAAASITTAAVQIDVDATAKTWTRASGSFITDGYVVGMDVTGAGFANGANNATFQVTGVTATVLTFAGATTFVTETGSGDETVVSAVDVLVAGTTKRSFTFEGYQSDLTGDKYVNYPGAAISGVNLSFQRRAVVTGSIGVQAANGNVASASLLGGGSLAAATTTDVMKTGSSVSGVTVDGAAKSGFRVQGIDLSLAREQERVEVVDSLSLQDLLARDLVPEISITAYFDDFDFYTKTLNSTSFAFGWKITTGADTYGFYLPKCKVQSGAPEGAQKGQSRVYPFTALGLRDLTSGPIVITRTP